MDMWQHASISGAVSAGIYYFTSDARAAAAFSATGVLVDLDHWVDYWRETGFNLRVLKFFKYFSQHRSRQLVIFMHGWEQVACAGIVTALAGFPSWAVAGTLGWLGHLVLDQIFNTFRPWGYFFFYRLRKGFDADKIFSR